jgi:hypothetical protein
MAKDSNNIGGWSETTGVSDGIAGISALGKVETFGVIALARGSAETTTSIRNTL